MNCEDIIEQLIATDEDALSILERSDLVAHLADCEQCQDALRGSKALRMAREQPVYAPPEDLFDRVMQRTGRAMQTPVSGSRFWLGTAFGGLLAAGIAVLVVSLGLFSTPDPAVSEVPVITMALGEQQDVSIAIDTNKALPGTSVYVVLSGGFEIDGFGSEKELSWTTDLEKGVNRLTLPLLAVAEIGGHLLVRLEHEGTQRVFRVDLKSSG